jgi:hypothetical protein
MMEEEISDKQTETGEEGPAGQEESHAAQVRRGEPFVVGDHLEHRRDHEDDRGPLALDQIERRARLEGAGQDGPAAQVEDRDEQGVEPAEWNNGVKTGATSSR